MTDGDKDLKKRKRQPTNDVPTPPTPAEKLLVMVVTTTDVINFGFVVVAGERSSVFNVIRRDKRFIDLEVHDIRVVDLSCPSAQIIGRTEIYRPSEVADDDMVLTINTAYYVNDHDVVNSECPGALIVAANEEDARRYLDVVLKMHQRKPFSEKKYTLTPIDVSHPALYA